MALPRKMNDADAQYWKAPNPLRFRILSRGVIAPKKPFEILELTNADFESWPSSSHFF